MPRGGYQDPGTRQPPSGPGRFSSRTDGQSVRVPNVQDTPDLQVGDRQMLEAGQRMAPARAAQPTGLNLAAGPPSGMGGEGLPPFVTDFDSINPNEPLTAGMDMGPGAGRGSLQTPMYDDTREKVLDYLARTYNNKDALAMLQEIRAQQVIPEAAMAQPEMPAVTMGGDPALAPEGMTGGDDFEDFDEGEALAEPAGAEMGATAETAAVPTSAPAEGGGGAEATGTGGAG